MHACVDQADPAVGQGPRFVGEEHVDIAEILNAHKSFDQNPEFGQSP